MHLFNKGRSFMGEWAENAAVLLKDSLNFCNTLAQDETGFNKLKDRLDSLLGIHAIPKALENQVKRTTKLVDAISSGTNDFSKGVSKLQESLSRMANSLPISLDDIITTESESPKEEMAAVEEPAMPKDSALSDDIHNKLDSFAALIKLFESERDSATIDICVTLNDWITLFEGLDLSNLHTLTLAVKEELLNNPEFHVATLQRYLPVITETFHGISTNSTADISEELLSTIFEVEDNYIHEHDASDNSADTTVEVAPVSVAQAPEPIVQAPEDSNTPVDASEETIDNNVSMDTIGDEAAFEKLEKETHKPTINADVVPIPIENYDLVLQFVENQGDTLALFEALALNYDDNRKEFGDEIRGILHTWKGEFGVLNMQKFSQLCHFLEDEMEKPAFRSDTLFRFKDLLNFKLKEIKNGANEVLLTDEEIAYLVSFNSLDTTKGAEPTASTEPVEEVSTPAVATVEIEQFDEGKGYPMPEDDDLLNGFITESREHLEIADASILELEKEGVNPELVDSLFRAYHTIKGVASFLSLEPIRFLAHEVENYIDLIRAGKIVLDQHAINLSLEGTDLLKHGVDMIADSLNRDTYGIPEGINEYLLRLQIALKSVGDEKSAPVVTQKVTPKNSEIPKQETQKEKVAPTPAVENASTEKTAEKSEAVSAPQKVQKSRKSNLSETVRVPVDRLDMLIDTIGEAVIAQSMVVADETISAIKKPELVKKIAQAEQIMRQVQELSMSMRMVSIKPTFQKMARLVRDLSMKFNKDIEFVMEGQDTDIDKSLVENIGDPLIHMVRNALDHGIESSSEERELMGKPAKATVTLRAFHKSGSIYIEIEDDGRGLDKERILEKAINQGLVRPEQELSENEIFNLIFKPGFSTAQEITDISGRGVGMDVVRRNIMDMRGAIHVTSELGKGTIFSIRLPLTLAIIDGMVVSACNERYIIPKLSIVESLIPTSDNLETVLGDKGQMIKFRGSYLVFKRLEDLFDLNDRAYPTPIENNGVIVILEDLNGNRVGLFVDKILGQQQVVIKNLGEGIMDIDGVAGGAIMSDGSVNLIIDVSSVVSMIE